MINLKIFNVTELMTNCCYLADEETGKSAVVDPGDKSEKLISLIEGNGSALEYVILTHAHYDHIGYAKQLADKFGARIVIGRLENPHLSDSTVNCTVFHGIELEPFSADILLSDGEDFTLGATKIKYISTPGHTKGGGCYIFDDTIIAGDTLFCESYGRTDLPTGSDGDMVNSLRKLKNLQGDYRVIPGHGALTTLEHERKYNPLMRSL